MKNKLLNKILICGIIIVYIVACLSGCRDVSNTNDLDSVGEIEKNYKKISLSSEALDEIKNVLTDNTNIVKKWNAFETSETMSVYEISPYTINEVEFKKYAEILGVSGKIEKNVGKRDFTIEIKLNSNSNVYEEICVRNGNELQYAKHGMKEIPLTDSDDIIIERATAIVNSLGLGEDYEFNGLSGEKILTTDTEKFTYEKSFCFLRMLEDKVVYGEDRCVISFSQHGLVGVHLYLYNYTETGNIEMLSLEEAFSKIKTPDNFYNIGEPFKFTEHINTLTFDNVSLRWKNYYNKGCEILQPIYSFQGTAEMKSSNKDVVAEIMAIPDKYIEEDKSLANEEISS